MNTRSMLIAAGVAGVVMALVSDIPFISLVNCCCWAGIWGSGILAVLLYRMIESKNPGLTVGQGVALGLITGLIGAVLGTVIGLFTSLLFSGFGTASYLTQLEDIPGMSDALPQASREMLRQFGGALGGAVFGAVCNFILYPLFGMLGSVIGTALIWKKQ
jgi:uncharacterized membrane protein